MKSRRMRRRQPNHERWLVSYADFITLLFAFFVVLYSVAQVDRRKIVELAEAIQEAFGEAASSSTSQPAAILQVPPGSLPKSIGVATTPTSHENPDLTALRKELESALTAEIAQGEVSIRDSSEGLTISLREGGFFDSGSAEIKAGSQDTFGRIAETLSNQGWSLRIEGHTDDRAIHNSRFSSNWELSTARATEVVRELITGYDFDPARLSAAGYAEFHPIASNDTEEGRATNRRVDLVILGGRPATR